MLLTALPLLTSLALPASAQGTVGPAPVVADRIPSPFLPLEDTGARGTLEVTFDRATADVFTMLHDAKKPVTVEGFSLPGGLSVDLWLQPVSVVEPGMSALVHDARGTHRLAPSVELFTGHVPGTGSQVFLGVSHEILAGYIELGDDLYFVSNGDGRAHVSHSDLFTGGSPLEEFCGLVSDTREKTPTPPSQQRGSTGSTLYQTKPYIVLDNDYRSRFSSDQAAIDYAVLLVGATSEIYRRDLGVTMILPNGYVELYTTTPPWGSVNGFNDLTNFKSWWNSPQNTNNQFQRSVVHLLTYPVFGGIAQGINLTCNRTTSFAISSVYGSFPYPIRHTSSSNWDLEVFSHENGHIYGSEHTFDYSPPIQCDDGSGPDKGTIMSYCHLTYGVGGVGMRFHKRVQDVLRAAIKTVPCPKVISVLPGDYDNSGQVDSGDLAQFDAYRVQGFLSRGAVDVFDLNDDGKVDDVDRSVMLVLMGGNPPPASTTVRNGSGVNCGVCYVPLSEPILGTTWSTLIGSYLGAPIPTWIFVASQPLVPGTMTPYGELLVGLNGFGGQTIFTSLSYTNGQWAEHHIALPFDPTLAGMRLYTQGAMGKPSGIELLNALDLTVGLQ
ncbi:MAG TPA: hypothetical protein ENJ09_15895 [Planctomycetes bacterium]|nr:hypothetical protein [Planctomycetota bacterium]